MTSLLLCYSLLLTLVLQLVTLLLSLTDSCVAGLVPEQAGQVEEE